LRKSNTPEVDPTVYQWWVPLTYINSKVNVAEKLSEWMSKDEISVSLSNLGASADQWVIFNADQQSLSYYFKCKYSTFICSFDYFKS
jgi:hypothetical protein